MLFELLTGQRPFTGAGPAEVIRAIQESDPPLPRTLREDIPGALQAICLTALARDPGDRYLSARHFLLDVERFLNGEAVTAIRENSGLLLNLSTGVSLESTLEERKRPIVHHRPELASLNPGTMNFCTVSYRDGRIIADKTYHNPLEGTLAFGTQMHRQGIKLELECFGLSHVHNSLFFFEHYDFLSPPLHFSFVFGVMGGLRFNVNTVNSLIQAIPQGATWQGIGAGPFCFRVAMASAIFGGHIRVGLEDTIYINPATKEKSRGNWDQVEKAVQIARMVGRDPASPAEAREILTLPSRK